MPWLSFKAPCVHARGFLLRRVIMDIKIGALYFLRDCFFEKVNDPYLKKDHETSQRPHYFAHKDKKNSLIWLIPCSSQIEKYERIIRKKQESGKASNGIKIIKIQNKMNALLFQDMLPVTEQYILKPYVRGGQPMQIFDKIVLAELERSAEKIIKLLRRGIKFTPTSPNVLAIEKLMLEELNKSKQET
jgi:hypothetical protein